MATEEDNLHSERPFSWWDKQHWKPQPPAAEDSPRPGSARDDELPQGDEKWRLNNPKKRPAK